MFRPIDIIKGLGAADRELLATCISLFEDSTLKRRLIKLFESSRSMVNGKSDEQETIQITAAIDECREKWITSPHSDDHLRLVLWMCLREAFALEPRLSISRRGTALLAEDISVAIISHFSNNTVLGNIKRKLNSSPTITPPKNFDDYVRQYLQDIYKNLLDEDNKAIPTQEKRALLDDVKAEVAKLSEEERKELLKQVDSKSINDQALKKILISGGSLTAFSSAVSVSGFSAYILAAKASALIPLVSGPALVSLVSVMANPITVIFLFGLISWSSTRSADRKVQFNVGASVAALLSSQGHISSENSIDNVTKSFRKIENMGAVDYYPGGKVIVKYKVEWAGLEPHIGKVLKPLPENLRQFVEHKVEVPIYTSGTRKKGILHKMFGWKFPGKEEKQISTQVAVLTLGDVIYSAAAINPIVIQSVDFARIEDLGGRLAFADYARKIMQLDPVGIKGATNNIKGYVAEQVVATELVAKGHQVSVPENSNEAGWDIMVDGEKFQVKCTDNIYYINNHFETYDYPVIVNSEMAFIIAKRNPEWADKVYYVDGFDNSTVTRVTEDTITAGGDMFDPDVPMFAGGVIALRNLSRYRRGELSANEAVEQSLLDGSLRVGLAVAGSWTGTGLGLLFFGPAGALIFGAGLPVLSQAQSGRVQIGMDLYLKSPSFRIWEETTNQLFEDIINHLEYAADKKIQLLREKYRNLGKGALSEYVKSRFTDDARYIKESAARIKSLSKKQEISIEMRTKLILSELTKTSIHPIHYQDELIALRSAIEEKPKVTKRLKELSGIAYSSLKKFGGAFS